MKRARRIFYVYFAVVSAALAQSGGNPSAAQIDLGVRYVGWDSSYAAPYNGSEILAPLTVSLTPWKGGRIFGQTEFAQGNYTDSATGATQNLSLSGLSDTVLGFETAFNSFALPSILNLGVNIPTGNSSWETQQSNSIVPTDFVDSDYRGRGWGLSLLYGLSIPAGSEQYGVAGGYLYSGAFNPSYGLGTVSEQLKLGDSFFVSLNHATDRGQGQIDVLRLSAFYFLNTQVNGSTLMQMGPNLNASYGWQNPKALSFEVGGQYYFPAQQLNAGGQLSNEPYNSLGPRFYLTSGYNFGDWALGARAKYVLPNGYPRSPTDALYNGGGFLLGLEPTYKVKLDAQSALRFSGSFDYVSGITALDSSGNFANVSYGRWTFGTHYEVNL